MNRRCESKLALEMLKQTVSALDETSSMFCRMASLHAVPTGGQSTPLAWHHLRASKAAAPRCMACAVSSSADASDPTIALSAQTVLLVVCERRERMAEVGLPLAPPQAEEPMDLEGAKGEDEEIDEAEGEESAKA